MMVMMMMKKKKKKKKKNETRRLATGSNIVNKNELEKDRSCALITVTSTSKVCN